MIKLATGGNGKESGFRYYPEVNSLNQDLSTVNYNNLSDTVTVAGVVNYLSGTVTVNGVTAQRFGKAWEAKVPLYPFTYAAVYKGDAGPAGAVTSVTTEPWTMYRISFDGNGNMTF